MNIKFLSVLTFASLFTNVLFAQFIVKDTIFSSNSVSNEGKVSGYINQGGPYSVWLPDSGNIINDIGGVAPGFGVGGQARFSTDGLYLCGTENGPLGAEMARYNYLTGQWTTLGSLGFPVGIALSGGFAISGDANTVVGNAWADTTGGYAYTVAVAYNPSEGIMDLGTLFPVDGKSTRANAVSFDGSVVVGWQDFNGPWKSAVWRKNPSGGYFPNEYILLDTLGSATDEYNQMGECSAVSADGVWIGGYGDYANYNQPWIWSRDSGVINLGSLPLTGNGYVSGMSANASVVVGWFDGQLFGDPQTPFIWTRDGGLQDLNYYVNTTLGYPTGTKQIYTAECISPDGNYIAGYGVDNLTFNYFTYRVKLNNSSVSISELSSSKMFNVFHSITSHDVCVTSNEAGKVFVKDLTGKCLFYDDLNGQSNLNLSNLKNGMYIIMFETKGQVEIKKVIKM
jgi:hypothetical protein